jgi:hypothetical protein
MIVTSGKRSGPATSSATRAGAHRNPLGTKAREHGAADQTSRAEQQHAARRRGLRRRLRVQFDPLASRQQACQTPPTGAPFAALRCSRPHAADKHDTGNRSL